MAENAGILPFGKLKARMTAAKVHDAGRRSF
jgi:hypothetical protein